MNSDFLDRYRVEPADVLESILTHSRDCIKLLTLDGKIQFASTSAADALRLTRADEAIGKMWVEFWPEEDRPPLEAAISAARAGASTRLNAATEGLDGAARHWEVTVSPVQNRDAAVTGILAVSTDRTAQTVLQHDDRRRREVAEHEAGVAGNVAREMRHRFKNQLAVIGAIGKLLARHTDDAREMATKLEDKLLALARAQDLLTENRDRPLPAPEAIAKVLTASGAGDQVRVLDCADVLLGDEAIQHLALLMGELQTNALKHGALSQAGGHIELTGTLSGAILTLLWREHCSHPVTPREQGNGGFQLIKRLGSAGRLRPHIGWHDDGIAVTFHLRTAGEAAGG